jgi:hypothetical protein
VDLSHVFKSAPALARRVVFSARRLGILALIPCQNPESIMSRFASFFVPF